MVSGPSGVGKGTLIRELIARRPGLRKSVSCTTRDPRVGERPGEDYRFISSEQFARMRREGELLEWAVVHQDTHYGTPRKPVEEALARGEDIILEIDYQGARSVRLALGGQAVLVFIAPPTWDDLYQRLVGRETESDAQVQKRLRTARREVGNMDLFEYVIVNRDVAQAVDELGAILTAEGHRLSRTAWRGLQRGLLAESEEQPR